MPLNAGSLNQLELVKQLVISLWLELWKTIIDVINIYQLMTHNTQCDGHGSRINCKNWSKFASFALAITVCPCISVYPYTGVYLDGRHWTSHGSLELEIRLRWFERHAVTNDNGWEAAPTSRSVTGQKENCTWECLGCFGIPSIMGMWLSSLLQLEECDGNVLVSWSLN